MEQQYEVVVEAADQRADAVLAAALPLTRSAAQKLIAQGAVRAAGIAIQKSTKLPVGTVLHVVLPKPKETSALPEDIALDILYEDDWLLVVNKPKGMVVHPAPGHENHTLVNALLHHCKGALSGINGEIRPGIVHRIDKDTSGLLLVAKNDQAHVGLAAQIQAHSFERAYAAVVHGCMKDAAGTVDLPIGRSRTDRKKMCVYASESPPARRAVTHYQVEQYYRGYTQLWVRLETGRTHQIRVHMAHLGHPVAGDRVYGQKKEVASLNGQCLHAAHVGFLHPKTGRALSFTAPLPDYFTDFLRRLGPADG